MNVQAYILNISAIQSIDELREMVNGGYAHTVEMPLMIGNQEMQEFTAPKWIMRGDIVFFYHAATTKLHNKRLRREVRNGNFKDADKLNEYLDYCDKLYDKYGSRIYAVGVIGDNPAYYSDSGWEHPHFKTRIFAPITNVVELDYPISSKQFKEFLPIARQQGITPVFGNAFMELKSLICRYNSVPYLEKCTTVSFPLKDVQKGTWIRFANENGRKYLNEAQFRKYYVDFLLMSISDNGKICSEVECIKDERSVGRVDNVILLGGAYMPVEVKLSATFDGNSLMEQLGRYANSDDFERVEDSSEYTWGSLVVVVDIFNIYMYDDDMKNTLNILISLDEIKSMADVRKLRNMIVSNGEVD